MFRLAIFTEAGEGIGYGHLARCMAIRDHFLAMGDDCALFLHPSGILPREMTGSLELFDWRNDQAEPASLAEKYDAALIDSYLVDDQKMTGIRQLFPSLVVLDDYNRISYPCDLVINPNVFGDRIDYRNQTAKILGGAEFVLLRSEILETPRKQFHREKLKQIAVTLGGSDQHHLLPKIVGALSPEYDVTAIAGSENYREQLEEKLNKSCRVPGFVDPAELASLFTDSDIVISAGGQTLHELAFLTVPTIAINVGADQDYNMQYYTDRGFLERQLHWQMTNLLEQVVDSLCSFASPTIRKQRSETGLSLIDGQGAARIHRTILDLSMA